MIPELLCQGVEQAGLCNLASGRVDLPDNGVMQAGTIGRTVASHLCRLVGGGLIEFVLDRDTLELVHLVLASLDTASDVAEFGACVLHGAADLAAPKILNDAARIQATFRDLERNNCHGSGAHANADWPS
ncbi:hypothetical protein NKH47_01795 [Mesorhizobium sp. M1060]|uniref:hypothetical protein n=1 Tax=Mesorhizobium sp. M1060 TaxID=2957052 RepID=UPI003338D2A3